MKKLFLFLLFIFSIANYSQKTTEVFQSSILKEKREITISLPFSYEKNTEKKYPLLILLDSNYLFDPFLGAINYGVYWDNFPEVIIVGINQSKNRFEDSETDEETGLLIKKGAAFYQFIGQELLPYLEKNYRLTPFKIIAGHDITAGFLNFFLYEKQSLFNAYISLSPELANNMEAQIPERLSSTKTPIFYYNSISDGDLKNFQNQNKLLDQNIKTISNSNLDYKFDNFKKTTHFSMVLQAIPNALYQIFETYQPISEIEYQETIVKLPNKYVKYLTNKYDNIEKLLGIKMNIRLNDFKAIETAIIKNGAYNEFEELAQISGKQYPKSMLYDYHMATYYEKKGDIKRAFKIYQNACAKDQIRDLTKEQMMNKVDDLKKYLPKSKKETKADLETPTEEKKP